MTFASYIRRERIVRMRYFWRENFDAVTLKRAPCWFAVATGNIHMKTSQEKK